MKSVKVSEGTMDSSDVAAKRVYPTKIAYFKMLKELEIRRLRAKNPKWTKFWTHPAHRLTKGHCKFLNKIQSLRFLTFKHYGYEIERPEIDEEEEEE